MVLNNSQCSGVPLIWIIGQFRQGPTNLAVGTGEVLDSFSLAVWRRLCTD